MLKKSKKVIHIGSDHAGYKMKNDFKEYLSKKYKVIDLGVFNEQSADYPDIAREVAEKVAERRGARGILICGTGIGMAMAANKVRGVRAADCTSVEMAEMARRHNDANILALGARLLPSDLAKKITDKFLTTDFEKKEERHVRRVEKMEAIYDLSKKKK
jgi:ribose 5-phosphate isomerase B